MLLRKKDMTRDAGLLLSKGASMNGIVWLTSVSMVNLVFIIYIMEKFQRILFVVE